MFNACASLLVAALGAGDGVHALLVSFSQVTTLRAHFREEKHLSVLAVPLISEGTVTFEAPSRLAREVTTPAPSKMVIDGQQLWMWDGTSVQTLPLGDNPIPRLFVDSFLEVLAGDEAGLRKLYMMTLKSSAKGWELTLTPLAPPLSDLVARLVFTGKGGQVASFQLDEKGGDRTVTTFGDAVVGKPLDSAERQRLFGLPDTAPGRAK